MKQKMSQPIGGTFIKHIRNSVIQ
ncbi:hypothetical protein Bhyg_03926 [Pseudolycoriella hygida]|uniref:Uncharacterized protein n=1 Tax=Pseudolycoriella hygida TaxID=35572 RepID=A0A9Q0S9Q9_9DIPT|nr:hypothetical protein Bhyg_03926 [Pseudolycoriella hygida]